MKQPGKLAQGLFLIPQINILPPALVVDSSDLISMRGIPIHVVSERWKISEVVVNI